MHFCKDLIMNSRIAQNHSIVVDHAKRGN